METCICDRRPPEPRRCHREAVPGRSFCESCLAKNCAHHHEVVAEPLRTRDSLRSSEVSEWLRDYRLKFRGPTRHRILNLAKLIDSDPDLQERSDGY